MKTEFNPLEALADISEDELNEFIELQEEAPKKRRRQKTRESFVSFSDYRFHFTFCFFTVDQPLYIFL